MRVRVVASVTLWLAAVTSIAAIAWLAIDAAGRQVTASSNLASLSAARSAAAASGAASSGPGSSGAAGSSGSADPTSGASGSASPSPDPAATAPDDTAPNDPKQKTSVVKTTVDPGDSAVSGIYSTTGGRIRVECQGSRITLDGGYAQPATGWSVRVQSGGPHEVEVIFDLRDQQALLVTSSCSNGRPHFDQDRIEAGSPQA